MFLIQVFAATLLIAFVASTNVKPCKKGQPLPIRVDVEGCVTPPCDVIKGTDVRMKVLFSGSRDNITTLNAEIHATAFGITGPYHLPASISDVCSNLLYDATCPIDNGEDVTYNFVFPMESYYPEIVVKIQASLVDEKGISEACFVVDIKVKKGATQTKKHRN